MTENNPMEPIRRLGERLQELAAEIGLDLKTFVPVVDFEHEHGHMIQAVFIYNEPVAVASAEQQEFDERLKEIERQLVAEAQEDKTTSVTEQMLALRARMQRGQPLLDEDD
jgi:hypothetical protein